MMPADAELPRYQCHNEAGALKIANIKLHRIGGDVGATITPEDTRYAAFEVDSRYLMKHAPQIGGYYVVYKDGYKTFWLADAFEDGYTLVP